MPAADAYSLREGPLKSETHWTIEDSALVRRIGQREVRWALADLTRFTLGRRVNRWGADLRVARLKFGRRTIAFTSLGWRSAGRPDDHTRPFAAFVRTLAAQGSVHAPSARFESEGAAMLAGGGLWWIAGLLGAGLVAIVAMGFSPALWRISVDWSARLIFVLLLLAAAAPWLHGRAERRFDPMAPPEDLLGA